MESNPSSFKTNPATGEVQQRRPVENVGWYNALVYANKLSVSKGPIRIRAAERMA